MLLLSYMPLLYTVIVRRHIYSTSVILFRPTSESSVFLPAIATPNAIDAI